MQKYFYMKNMDKIIFRNSASKRGDLDSDTNISEYSENSSKVNKAILLSLLILLFHI